MALTRKMLKGMGLTEEQIDTIIEGHDDTVSALKEERDGWKEKAGKAEDLEKQVKKLEGDLEAQKGGTDWKAEYDKLKADTEAKETASKVRAAYRNLLKDQKVDDDMIDTIMDATKFDGMKLDKDGALAKAEELSEGIKTKWAKFIVTEGTQPTKTATPPSGGKTGKTREEILAIKDTAQRQRAMAENAELFGLK